MSYDDGIKPDMFGYRRHRAARLINTGARVKFTEKGSLVLPKNPPMLERYTYDTVIGALTEKYPEARRLFGSAIKRFDMTEHDPAQTLTGNLHPNVLVLVDYHKEPFFQFIQSDNIVQSEARTIKYGMLVLHGTMYEIARLLGTYAAQGIYWGTESMRFALVDFPIDQYEHNAQDLKSPVYRMSP